jgi:hypothetical protein
MVIEQMVKFKEAHEGLFCSIFLQFFSPLQNYLGGLFLSSAVVFKQEFIREENSALPQQ